MIQQNLPSDYVVFIKDGEFEIIKENLNDIEPEMIDFLNTQTDEKKFKKKVTLLRGGVHIYQKTK